MSTNYINAFLESIVYEEKKEPQVKIPVEKGDLGLSLDAPVESFINQIKGGKKWGELSKQLNTLYVFNKAKNPEVAAKARKIFKKVKSWVEKNRKSDPNFAK